MSTTSATTDGREVSVVTRAAGGRISEYVEEKGVENDIGGEDDAKDSDTHVTEESHLECAAAPVEDVGRRRSNLDLSDDAQTTYFKDRSPQPVSITDLPYPVIIRIFGHLSVTERLSTDTVSKKWRECVSLSFRVKKSFHYRELIKTTRLEPLMQRMSGLHSIILCDNKGGVSLPRSPDRVHLKSLRSFTGYSPDFEEFVSVVTELPQLKELILNRVKFDRNVECPVSYKFEKETQLRSVNSSLKTLVAAFQFGTEILAEAFQDLEELRFADQRDDIMRGDYLSFANLRLRVLEIGEPFPQCREKWSASLLSLFDPTASSSSNLFQSLEELIVPLDVMSDSDRRAFLRSIAEWQNLTRLRFRRETLFWSSFPVKSFFSVAHFEYLRDLTFECHPKGDFSDGIVFRLPHLERIAICGCYHGFNGQPWESNIVKFVSAVLRDCPSLHRIRISEFEVEISFFRAFARLGPCTKTLTLELSQLCGIRETSALGTCESYLKRLESQAKIFGVPWKFCFASVSPLDYAIADWRFNYRAGFYECRCGSE